MAEVMPMVCRTHVRTVSVVIHVARTVSVVMAMFGTETVVVSVTGLVSVAFTRVVAVVVVVVSGTVVTVGSVLTVVRGAVAVARRLMLLGGVGRVPALAPAGLCVGHRCAYQCYGNKERGSGLQQFFHFVSLLSNLE